MLYNFLFPLADEFGIFNLFRYLTFRTGGAIVTALLISFILGAPLIRWLRSVQGEGQPIREDGPEGHPLTKKGTPTMGGVLILTALSIATLLWADLSNRYVWAVLIVTLGFGAIGFADDYLKLSKRSSDGMPGKIKLVLELSIACAVGLWIMEISEAPLSGALAVPFLKEVLIDLGWFFVPFAAIVMVGSSNAVNLTDGLDGLAIVPAMIVAACFALIAYLVGNSVFAALSAASRRARLGRTRCFLRRAGRREPWVSLVQRTTGDGVHGRHRLAFGRRRAGDGQRYHQA